MWRLQARKYDDGRVACEQALAMIQTHPVRPHPREAAIKDQLATFKTLALEVDMKAKGYVLYDSKWVTAEEKLRLEQQSKGLVEYQGEWMTKDQKAEAERKGGTGKVFYDGKWMTLDQKMTAQGYVQFEGRWVRSEERDALLTKRQEEKDQQLNDDKKAADERLAAATAEKLKSVAYVKSGDFLKDKYPATATMKFEVYGSAKVQVIFDDGWYIVRGSVTAKDDQGNPISKVFYCKLRPKDGGKEWEADTTILND